MTGSKVPRQHHGNHRPTGYTVVDEAVQAHVTIHRTVNPPSGCPRKPIYHTTGNEEVWMIEFEGSKHPPDHRDFPTIDPRQIHLGVAMALKAEWLSYKQTIRLQGLQDDAQIDHCRSLRADSSEPHTLPVLKEDGRTLSFTKGEGSLRPHLPLFGGNP